MDIRHLQYFLKAAQYKSFTKAAQSLYITQPTISKMIKSIEEELGVELFNRSGKQVELTDAGQVIFAQAQDIVNSFDNLSTELDDLMNLKRGRISIGLPPMIGSSFFPKVLGKFREQYPDVTIHLVEDGAKKVEADVESGQLDMGVVLSPTNEALFHSFSLVKEKLMVLVHPSHPLAEKEKVTLSELQQEFFVFFRKDFALHDRVIAECVRVGFHPQVIYESSQWDFISEMVAANLGVALLPEPICRELDKERIRVLPLVEPVIPWHLVMIWRKERYLSFAAREWLRFTQDLFERRHEGEL
ncbi:LysR family transcriptional regulator [Bacillus sp. FJAT-27231]|uniref:cidABC operon transcriptional activator CidR n=1 Tax=Bacillus sp. FJAT-27231 TaxID=1679168 RepID=UPI0006709D60|nr:LysR family transcriptional regulator [Bacillus sp. FJAT-27231]KMY55812.1 LysR family transcriptional regulator [Bacillus sp. FJAT-27231]